MPEQTIIPEEFRKRLPQSTRYCKIHNGEKGPFERGWDVNGYTYEQLVPWLNSGGNYGIIAAKPLIEVETDDPIFEEGLPETLAVRSGSGHGLHRYYLGDLEQNGRIGEGKLGHVQVYHKCVVGPGSTHPSGGKYTLINDKPIANITKKQLEKRFGSLLEWKNQKTEEEDARTQVDKFALKIADIYSLSNLQRNGEEYFGAHPIHGSTNEDPHNFWMNPAKNVWHCFRCDSGGSALELIALLERKLECEQIQPGCLRHGLFNEIVEIAVEKYHAKPIKLETIDQIQPDAQFWPTIPEPIECDDETLNKELDEFITKHLEFTRPEETVVFREWIKLTWIAETLYTTPYLHFIGPKRSGKSRALEVLQFLCYKGILSANISPACIYHATQTYHPTLLCDEMDAYTGKRKTDKQDDIQYILNSGYRRGLKALRMEEHDGQKIMAAYDVFGPKALAGTDQLRDTTEDRCLPFYMTKNVKSKPIIINFPKAKELRAKLHAWRNRLLATRPSLDSFASFDAYTPTAGEETLLINDLHGLDNRLAELLLPLGVLGSKENKVDKAILDYAKELNEERQAEERAGFDADIIRVIVGVATDEKGLFTTREVTDVFNIGRPEKAQWSPDSVGHIISRLGFKKDRTKTGSKAWRKNEKHFEDLRDRYTIWTDEELEQRKKKEPAKTEDKPEPPAPSNKLRRMSPSEGAEKCELCGEFACEYELTMKDGSRVRRCQHCVDDMRAKEITFVLVENNSGGGIS
jgi:hypothetical protein